MKHNRWFVILLALLPILFWSCARKDSGPPPEDVGKIVGRSTNWRVEIISAKREKVLGKPGLPYELALNLKIQYLGPSGTVQAPTFNVLNERREKLAFSGTISFPAATAPLARWLTSGLMESMFGPKDPPKPESMTSLETGKSFEFGVNYMSSEYVEGVNSNQQFQPRVTTPAKNLRLVFADVPPIPFEVKSGS